MHKALVLALLLIYSKGGLKMAENYDLIFGQGASSQYAWSDSDYQNGWQTVGSTPPTAEQFDALQRRSDTKAKELNDRLTPIETNNTHDYRQPSTAYVVGNIAYHASLPTGYYLECTTGGTTSRGDLTISSPSIGGTVSDGTVKWQIRKGVTLPYELPKYMETLLDDKDAKTARATLGAPSTTGENASGSWNINAATATKLSTARKINITGNASGSAAFDGSGDVSISTTVNESKHAVNADVAKIISGFSEIDSGNWGHSTGTFITGFHEKGGGGIQWRAEGGSLYQQIDGTFWQREGMYEVIDTSTVNNYAPTKTGDGASGTWGINISGNAATATKLATPRTISLTGNASGSANFDGSGDISISTTVNESKHAAAADTLKSSVATETSTEARPVWLSWEGDNTKQTVSPNLTYTCGTKTLTAANFKGHLAGNADTATTAAKLATARTISLTGNASGSANFDGSGNVTINTTVSEAAHAAKAKLLDGFSNIDDGTWGNCGGNWVAGFHESGGAVQWRTHDGSLYQQIDGTYWQREGTYEVIDTSTVNNYAPTKTGDGASGTWGINISGNAGSATDADKLDGYHASDLLDRITNITPKTAAAIGQFRELVVNDSHQVKLPDGGTWAYFCYTYNSWSGGDSNVERRTRTGAGIAAGGTVIHTDGNITSNTINAFKLSGTTGADGADGNAIIVGGFCWRIA